MRITRHGTRSAPCGAHQSWIHTSLSKDRDYCIRVQNTAGATSSSGPELGRTLAAAAARGPGR
jgi:hypothetical protein